MPRHQKSFDEQYLKENYTIKENHVYSSQGNYSRVRSTEVARPPRPASYAGDRDRQAPRAPPPPPAPAPATAPAQYASSGMLDELECAESGEGAEALKTRSLPAFLRPRPRPLSSEADLYQLYAKVSQSKKHKSRMRSEHAAIIALSKSRSQALDIDAGAVIVYDQRTQL
ncbi:uncharacterized protein LOC126368421 isoform X2 [Pectinophora gossypiella]|nr:uncharacterized protein LOC126368421 isoform X2 [Pectinophora gossypiella]XP_049868392.1 uncharacterized protein LOC126368421 isoform X2 [Pectinophora gossypiella]